MDVVTIIIVLYVEIEQLISLTFTKIYLYCLKATEKESMFSGHGGSSTGGSSSFTSTHTTQRVIHITNRE